MLHKTTHAKFLIIDQRNAYIFTANYNEQDFEKSFNIGIKLNKQQTIELLNIISMWQKQMPFSWKKEQNVIDTIAYNIFEKEQLCPKTVQPFEIKKEEKVVKTVKDFIYFFSQKQEFNNNGLISWFVNDEHPRQTTIEKLATLKPAFANGQVELWLRWQIFSDLNCQKGWLFRVWH